jgi:AcrR family transcriptional regulator
MSAVAARAGLSRVTIYAHFPTREALLEAAVERAVRRVVTALEAARPDEGPAIEALDRLLAAAWQHLAGYSAMAQAVAESLSPEAVARAHHAAYETIGGLAGHESPVRRDRSVAIAAEAAFPCALADQHAIAAQLALEPVAQ